MNNGDKKMKNEIEQLKAELKKLDDKFKAVRDENSVECNAPKLKKTYRYRKQTVVRGLEPIVIF
jgi:hypothetical protein